MEERDERMDMDENIEEARIADKYPNFLRFGKYFLIFLLIIAQAFFAYQIIDKNYEQIYSFIGGITPDQSGTYQMEELVVNPAGTQGQRYLVVEIGLELEHKDHIQLIESRKQKIKHEMNETLSSRTIDQLVQYEERERLRSELANIVNQAIGTRSVRNLYYTRYVMQ